MRHLLDDIVFHTSDRTFAFSDVIAAATFWGDWQRLELRVRRDLACVRMMQAGQMFDKRSIDTAADRFRYDHDLLTAEETEAWLEGWGLSLGDWLDYIRRLVARERCTEESRSIDNDEPTPDVMTHAMMTEAICSGELARLTRRLAGRAAVFSRMRADSDAVHQRRKPTDLTPSTTERIAVPAIASTTIVDSELATVFLERLDSAFSEFSRAVAGPAVLADCLARNQQRWTRVDCTCLLFDTENRAREGAIALRDDGETPDAVRLASGAAIRAGSFYLDDLEPELRDRLRSAATGTWIGPCGLDAGFVVFIVREKVLPTLDDPEIRRRAARVVVDTAVEHEMAARVTWRRRLDT